MSGSSLWVNIGTLVLAVLLIAATAFGISTALDKRQTAQREPRPIITASSSSTTTRGTGTRTAIAPVTTILSAQDDRTVWSGRTGTCGDGGARVAISHDGGKAWSPVKLPANVRVLARVRTTGAESAFIVAAGKDCTPKVSATGDGGQTWTDPKVADESWARSPQGGQNVVAPGGRASQACRTDVVDLGAATEAGAVVLCSDGQVVTSATGRSWSVRDQLPRAVAVTRTDDAVYAAELDASGCRGVRVSEVQKRVVDGTSTAAETTPTADGSSSSTKPMDTCVRVTGVRKGSVALAVVDGTGWLAIEGDLYRSDDLKQWFPSGTVFTGTA